MTGFVTGDLALERFGTPRTETQNNKALVPILFAIYSKTQRESGGYNPPRDDRAASPHS